MASYQDLGGLVAEWAIRKDRVNDEQDRALADLLAVAEPYPRIQAAALRVAKLEEVEERGDVGIVRAAQLQRAYHRSWLRAVRRGENGPALVSLEGGKTEPEDAA